VVGLLARAKKIRRDSSRSICIAGVMLSERCSKKATEREKFRRGSEKTLRGAAKEISAAQG